MKLPWRSRARREVELERELRSHFEMAVALRMERGESRTDAERNARLEFGNVTHVAEVTRDMWGGRRLETLRRDLVYAWRGLRRSPTFAVVAMLTFALGIGATSTMFTIVNGVLLRPLPFDHPEQLVLLGHVPKAFGSGASDVMSDGTFLELRAEHSRAFASFASFGGNRVTLTGAGEPVEIIGAAASANFTRVLGVSPARGRGFADEEETPGSPRVVILGDRMWHDRFNADPGVVGRSIVLNGVPHTVVGIMPRDFDFPNGAAFWTPLSNKLDPTLGSFRPVVARLRDGVTRETAVRELEATFAVLPSTASEKPGTAQTNVRPLLDLLVARSRATLWLFSGAVVLVLLIACANVANLFLIRVVAREHEIAVRFALGAGRTRIVRQLLTESALVASIGGAVGLLFSVWGVRAVIAAAPAGRIPRQDSIGVDWRVLGATLGISLLMGIACGIVPALTSTRRDLRSILVESARTLVGGHDRLRRALVVVELALAIVLLSAAGLLLKSFVRMRTVDPGFRAAGVVEMGTSLSAAKYPTPQAATAFAMRVLERLREIPGVDDASVVNFLPLVGGGMVRDQFQPERGPELPNGNSVGVLVTAPDYFRAMGIRIRRGRDFAPSDDAGALPVTIISASVARKFWPPDGEGAIGQRARKLGGEPNDWATIVGIVDDVVQTSIADERQGAQYLPVMQNGNPWFVQQLTFVIRTARPADDVAPSMRAILHEIDPSMAVRHLAPMEDVLSSSVAQPRFEMQLVTIFSALALLLAAIGTYGVLAHDVASRTHEIGLRVALGAGRRDVVRVVARRTLGVVIPGIVIGLAGAAMSTSLLRKSLFQVTPTDGPTLAWVAITLCAVAAVAAAAPTWRAARVDPLVALNRR
jgi:putative ABC transport system permease protein